GTSDIAYNNGMETMKVLRSYGITVNYWEHTGSHSFVAWKQDLRDFVPFLFQYGITTSLEENPQVEGIEAYPNPFTESMLIKSKLPFQYQLFSIDGEEIESGKGNNLQTIGGELKNGTYVLKLKTNNGQNTFKVVKQ
ncbi:MAG: T9SS type A sorting domain-containing protein, partial [Bacteroidia bacterium]|nr:T9SS type A sorting domain-containing protein [Bacteroidia bacterium]